MAGVLWRHRPSLGMPRATQNRRQEVLRVRRPVANIRFPARHFRRCHGLTIPPESSSN